MIKLMHIITGLEIGGAEMMLFKLSSKLDSSIFSSRVISLTDIGPIGNKLQGIGTSVEALGMHRGIPDPIKLIKFIQLLKRDKPDIVQTWMYHSDLFGGVATKFAGGIPTIWGIHHSNLELEHNKYSTIMLANICAKLSNLLPTKIVCCSEASRKVHMKLDYECDKMLVIENGFDTSLFCPNQTMKEKIRAELGISNDATVIGVVGRFDPLKDYPNFLKAAAILCKKVSNVRFLLCGDNLDWGNSQLSGWIDSLNIRDVCYLLGRRNDVQDIFATLDIAVSSSCGEGFPNVIGEAMACGVPCVVTDVGDSALIVGKTGRVVLPRNPEALAEAIQELIIMGSSARREIGISSRKRIETCFSLPSIVEKYQNLYKSIYSAENNKSIS